jgi:hypothetical protein
MPMRSRPFLRLVFSGRTRLAAATAYAGILAVKIAGLG